MPNREGDGWRVTYATAHIAWFKVQNFVQIVWISKRIKKIPLKPLSPAAKKVRGKIAFLEAWKLNISISDTLLYAVRKGKATETASPWR